MINFWKKLTQESLRFDKVQKSFKELNVSYKKLEKKSSCLSNFVKKDLILVRN